MFKPILGLQVLAFAVAVSVWVLVDVLANVPPSVLPSFSSVVQAMGSLWLDPRFVPAVLLTLQGALIALAIGSVLGIGLGLLIGMNPRAEEATRLVVDFGRSFPVVAMIPIVLLVFGATTTMKVVVVSTGCFFPVLVQTIYGARRMESTLKDTVRAYRIPAGLKFFRVILPAALPFIFTGFRIATVLAILVTVGVEITTPVQGMGHELAETRNYHQTDVTFAYVLYAGLLGVIVNLMTDRLEKGLLGWHLQSEKR